MSNLSKNIELFIRKNNLFTKKDKLLLAFSGGQDSSCLLHILYELEYDVHAAHVNYHLRGSESLEDESFVVETCNKLNIGLHLHSHKIESKTNVQEQAREIRYNYFNGIKEKLNCNYILTAHHQDDQFETVFLNFLRGSGAKGLGGMSILEGDLVRPLLLTPKKEIIDYCLEKSIKFREDSSNSKNDYQRNFLRNKIIPELIEKFPGVQNKVLNASINFKNTSEWIESEMKGIIEELQLDNELIRKNELLFHPMRSYILQSILSPLNFSTSLIRDINNKITTTEIGKKFYNNSRSHVLVVGRNYLKLARNEPKPKRVQSFSVTDLIAQLRLYGISLTVNSKYNLIDKEVNSFRLDEKSFFNRNVSVGPMDSKDLIINNSSKITVNKFISNKKLEPWEKDLIAVLKIDARIVWIPGYWKDSESVKIEEGEDVYLLTANRI